MLITRVDAISEMKQDESIVNCNNIVIQSLVLVTLAVKV